MRKYFELSNDAEPSVIGVKDGLNQCYVDKSCFHSMKEFNKYNEFYSSITYMKNISAVPDFDLRMKFVKLYSKAKVTDFIKFELFNFWIHFVVSEKVKNLFYEFKVDKVHFFPVKLFQNNVVSEQTYYLMHMENYDMDVVDFNTSIFVNEDIDTEEITILPSKNYEEYWKSYKAHKVTSYFQKLNVFKSKITNIHFIRIKGKGIFISESLKDKIIENKFTGLEIYEAKHFNLV